ncbi:MAG: AAA family ATPase [Castellaniella sp.]|nr:AAA family ATPase [Castellaniella sp.]
MAFNAGNLLVVAQDPRRAHPDAQITLAADNDIKAEGPNVGRQKAQEAAKAIGGTLALPDLDGRACDWWDVRHERGDGALKVVFTPTPRFRLLGRDDLRKLPDLEWMVDGVLPMDGIGLVIGQSGAGKSFVTLDLLARVSLGLPWFGHDCRRRQTVYVGLEGRAGIKRRIETWERQNGAQVAGKIYGTPKSGTGKSGANYVNAIVRVATTDGGSLMCSVIAFDEAARNGLMALGNGDGVSL